jgi:GNAT superfamily N-acetyltransferase
MNSVLETSMTEVRRITFAELTASDQWDGLVSEYSDECQIAGLPRCKGDNSTYYLLENSGLMNFAAAFVGDTIVGFSILMVTQLPHYSRIIAVVDSIFVAKKHRNSGAGMMLIREMESLAKDNEAIGILVSAPKGGRLNALMPNIGYAHTNEVFFKSMQ